MYIECSDFYETETAFFSKTVDLSNFDLSNKKLVVKAHEKEIFCISDNLIFARVHRDNNGVYPFSKVDYLSHKLQEMVFPQNVPKLHSAMFDQSERPVFILDRIELDKLHIAYNIKRQIEHQSKGNDYYFNKAFFDLDEKDDIDELAKMHTIKVDRMQRDNFHFVHMYGIAFDHSHVNITWRKNGTPVSLEVHKCRREYLFSPLRCREYLSTLQDNPLIKDALTILNRIEQLL